MMAEGPMPIRLSVRTILTLGDKMQRHPASEKLYWEFSICSTTQKNNFKEFPSTT